MLMIQIGMSVANTLIVIDNSLPNKKYLYDKLVSFKILFICMCIDKPPKEINITAIISLNFILLIIVNAFKPCVSSKNPFMNT